MYTYFNYEEHVAIMPQEKKGIERKSYSTTAVEKKIKTIASLLIEKYFTLNPN